ncbi:hypothetical protein Tco_1275418 [Tanacetum coccineum]
MIGTPYSISLNTPYRSVEYQYAVLSSQNTMYWLEEHIHRLDCKTQYVVLGRRFDTSYPTGGYGVSEPPRYYTKIDNRPSYAERRQSLEELLAKHQEESARRSTKMEVWIKKRQENADIDTRNQSASLKNLETQIEQLTKEIRLIKPLIYPQNKLKQLLLIRKHLGSTNSMEYPSYQIQKVMLLKFYNTNYHWEFNLEIDKLADEYKLRIGKKGHILNHIWEYCNQVHNKNYEWHNYEFENKECEEIGIEDRDYHPPEVQVETFEVKKYSFKGGQGFICVTKDLDDTLPLGMKNEYKFKEMIRMEVANNKT